MEKEVVCAQGMHLQLLQVSFCMYMQYRLVIRPHLCLFFGLHLV